MNSTGASINLTYVAVNPTGLSPSAYQASTTIYGNPLSGPGGTPQAISNPGTISMGTTPHLVSVILPGMHILGATGGGTIGPYGIFGSTGTGGVGSYILNANQASFTFTATGTNGATQITLSAAPATTLVQGQAISGTGFAAGTTVGTIVSGTGGSGSVYNISQALTATLSGSNNVTAAGTIGSSGTPVSIYVYTAFYYTAASVISTAPYGSVAAPTRANHGDFISVVGNNNTTAPYGSVHSGWGGTIGNAAMLYGVFPATTSGAPNTASLASLCKKTIDIPAFATANGLTVNSLYRLNDLGVFGNSSVAEFTGYISGASGTSGGTATLNLSTSVNGPSTVASMPTNTIISGVGIAGCPSSCPKLTTPSTGVITFGSGITSANLGSSGSPVALKGGAFAPMTPLQSNTFTGYVDNAGSVPTLHITALPTSPTYAAATFTGSLVSSFTGGTGGTSSTTLTVTAPTSASAVPVLGVGTQIQTTPGTVLATVPGQLTSTAASGVLGEAGTYSLNTAINVANGTMYGTGPLASRTDHVGDDRRNRKFHGRTICDRRRRELDRAAAPDHGRIELDL